jgi:hypothetical protein
MGFQKHIGLSCSAGKLNVAICSMPKKCEACNGLSVVLNYDVACSEGVIVVTDEGKIAERLHDFQQNPSYDLRIVAFYDFLGWRSKIAEAGTDPENIGRLRRMILRHTRSLGGQQQYAAPDIKFSSFSDNVVVSQPADRSSILHVLATLGAFQLVSVADGFLVRGGVTIGPIHHDNVSVFGPALNRAYELESQVAEVPRIVIDTNVLEALDTPPFLIERVDQVHFLNPFTIDFARFLISLEQSASENVYATLGFPEGQRSLADASPDILLKFALNGIKPQIRFPLADKEWNKLAWVYDRLATQLGVPPARSYPRVRPGEMVE